MDTPKQILTAAIQNDAALDDLLAKYAGRLRGLKTQLVAFIRANRGADGKVAVALNSYNLLEQELARAGFLPSTITETSSTRLESLRSSRSPTSRRANSFSKPPDSLSQLLSRRRLSTSTGRFKVSGMASCKLSKRRWRLRL